MGKLKKITLLMADDEELEFIPTEIAESYLSISRGHRDSPTGAQDTFMGYPVQEPNGKEVFILISAPKEIKDEIVKEAMKIIDKMINS
jgi:hypothetical protein